MTEEFLNKIICGNAVDVLKKLDTNSINLTITSPPYGNMRNYKGNITNKLFDNYYSFPFIEILNELYRITIDGGIVVFVIGDQIVNGGESGVSFRSALAFMDAGFKLYDTMIYMKNGAPFPETGRYSQIFEYMFVFLKGEKPNTVNLLKDKINKYAGSAPYGKRTHRVDDKLKNLNTTFIVDLLGIRENIWKINNGAGHSAKDKIAFDHPAIFPEALAEDMILSWSNNNDVILDPFSGSGTTAKMSKLNNRNFIGIDIVPEYCDIANKRLEKVIPYTIDNTNPKSKFIVTREEILEKRRLKKEAKKNDKSQE